MVAEFESDLIRLRTREGMKVAKAKGRLRGKQPKLNRRQEAHLVSLVHSGEYSTAEVADLFGVGRSTVYRAIERQRIEARASRNVEDADLDAPASRIRHPRGTLAPTGRSRCCGPETGSVTRGRRRRDPSGPRLDGEADAHRGASFHRQGPQVQDRSVPNEHSQEPPWVSGDSITSIRSR